MLFSRMVGGLGNQLFQTAAFLKYRSEKEKVIISFLGDIHIPKRENCLNYIFEIPDWLYYDNSRKINLLTRFVARSSAGLRFGSYAPYIGVNDRSFYKKNSYGIRIENLVFVKKVKKKISFENLTLVPIEKDLINFNILTKLEKNYLFKYHLDVYSKISKYLSPNERKWLASYI